MQQTRVPGPQKGLMISIENGQPWVVLARPTLRNGFPVMESATSYPTIEEARAAAAEAMAASPEDIGSIVDLTADGEG